MIHLRKMPYFQGFSGVNKNLGKKLKKIEEIFQKILAIFSKVYYYIQVPRGQQDKRCTQPFMKGRKWLVGQAVKTPPSHGGNRGSIPLRAVDYFKNSPTLKNTDVS